MSACGAKCHSFFFFSFTTSVSIFLAKVLLSYSSANFKIGSNEKIVGVTQSRMYIYIVYLLKHVRVTVSSSLYKHEQNTRYEGMRKEIKVVSDGGKKLFFAIDLSLLS